VICCLENAIDFYQFDKMDWSLLFEFLWKYPTGNEIKDLALWHENEAECTAFYIMDDLPYEKSEFEFISKEHYKIFESLYLKSNKTIWKLTNSIASIGTQYLYGGVKDGAPETLNELNRVIDLLISEDIPIPDYSNFEKFNYPKNPESDWIVWGDKIEFETLKRISKWIK